MNKAKAASATNGRAFLRRALLKEQQLLIKNLEFSAETITHSGVMGEVNEQHFIDVLRKYLPNRYAISQGIVVDCNGATSDQIDIVIYDRQYTPTLLDQQNHRYIPAEAVYCVLEAKPSINKQTLAYAGDKAASVRRLERTSVTITHAGGTYPPKPHVPIVAGLVAPRIDWKDGCSSPAFAEAFGELQENRALDCGVALSDCAFDTYTGTLNRTRRQGSLALFLFSLLFRLQSLGTVPAVDWNRYGEVLCGDED